MIGPDRFPTAALLLVAIVSCQPATAPGGWDLPSLRLDSFSPTTWLPGTRVVVRGRGFAADGVGLTTVRIVADAGGQAIAVEAPMRFDAGGRASFRVGDAVPGPVPVDGPEWVGTLIVERSGAGVDAGAASLPLKVRVVSNLVATVTTVAPAVAWPGESMTVDGDGFLLAGEGQTQLVLSGTWTDLASGVATERDGRVVPLKATGRAAATFDLGPSVFGISPGSFSGQVTPRNVVGAMTRDGTARPFSLTLNRPELHGVGPSPVRRGAAVEFSGRGFLAVDAAEATATVFDFTVGTATLSLVPDSVPSNGVASLVLRPQPAASGKPAGLGASPEVLQGLMVPRIVAGGVEVRGEPVAVGLEVAAPVQQVFVRFLPTWNDGLAVLGIDVVADAVRSRALLVTRGDYSGLAIDVGDAVPQSVVDFTTVEVMGSDPNGAGLLGLDNTLGKDVWNARFDDLLGGYNAEGEDAGYYGYGGVFVDSFLGFSPTLYPRRGQTTAAFDQVFAPFAPALGGTPVTAADLAIGASRAVEVAEAIRVAGNLIGDTVTHEFGHALGLAAVDGQFHDPGDTPGYIMDAGVFRPFAERAQLAGSAARVFAPYDRAYLESILPAE